jgi:hypothetical protein
VSNMFGLFSRLQFPQLFSSIGVIDDDVLQTSSEGAVVDKFEFRDEGCSTDDSFVSGVLDDSYVVTTRFLHIPILT